MLIVSTDMAAYVARKLRSITRQTIRMGRYTVNHRPGGTLLESSAFGESALDELNII
jgi:hypothetical protein